MTPSVTAVPHLRVHALHTVPLEPLLGHGQLVRHHPCRDREPGAQFDIAESKHKLVPSGGAQKLGLEPSEDFMSIKKRSR